MSILSFFTKEGVGAIFAIGVLIFKDHIPTPYSYIAALVMILYIIWYLKLCYAQAMMAFPDAFTEAYRKMDEAEVAKEAKKNVIPRK